MQYLRDNNQLSKNEGIMIEIYHCLTAAQLGLWLWIAKEIRDILQVNWLD
jgi:hypothetical protein